MVTYVWYGEADPTTCANCGDLASYDVAVSKVTVVNAKASQDYLRMTLPVARKLSVMVGRN